MRPQLRSFEGQTAVITGGGTGVGAAVALALADAGASIVLIGRRLNRLELVAATVRTLGLQIHSRDPRRGSDRSERHCIMKVVLFCGGLGTRIRDYSENIPKPMVPIDRFMTRRHASDLCDSKIT